MLLYYEVSSHCIHVYTLHTHISVCMYVCRYVCAYTHTHTYIYIYIYIHICICMMHGPISIRCICIFNNIYTYISKISNLQLHQLITWLSEWNPIRSQEATVWCPTGTVINIYYSLLSVLLFWWYARAIVFSKHKETITKNKSIVFFKNNEYWMIHYWWIFVRLLVWPSYYITWKLPVTNSCL